MIQFKNDGTIPAAEFEYHLCFFVNHEAHDGREEKQEEGPGTAGPDFYATSALPPEGNGDS